MAWSIERVILLSNGLSPRLGSIDGKVRGVGVGIGVLSWKSNGVGYISMLSSACSTFGCNRPSAGGSIHLDAGIHSQ